MFVAFPASGIYKTNFEVKKSWQNLRQNQPNVRKKLLGVNRRSLCGLRREGGIASEDRSNPKPSPVFDACFRTVSAIFCA
jgi:hypothetical protein